MKTTRQNINIETTSQQLDQAFGCMDQERAKGMTSLGRVRAVKAKQKEKEAARLAKKYGETSPQAQRAYAQVTYTQKANISIAQEVKLVQIDRNPFPANAWRLQGRVVDAERNGQANLTISLFDRKGTWSQELGQACTDGKGYFTLDYVADEKSAEQLKESVFFITVSDQNKRILHQEKEPVQIALGEIEDRLIILQEEVCVEPPATIQEEVVVVKAPVWRVKGTVSDRQTGRKLQGLTVSLFDKDLIFDDELGTTQTDEKGQFSFSFNEEDYKSLFESKPKIYLKVMDESGKTLYSSRKQAQIQTEKEEVFDIRINRK